MAWTMNPSMNKDTHYVVNDLHWYAQQELIPM